MRKYLVLAGVVGLLATAAGAYAVSTVIQAQPDEFDPFKTELVQATWLGGIGCPTGADIEPGDTYTDPACPTGDEQDRDVEGLLLAKTGPTANTAAALATLTGVKGIVLTELGYDIRKPGLPADPRGSHCGAGAPRFNVATDEASYFIGCNSPPADLQQPGTGWLRLRWGAGAAPLLGFNAQTGALEPVVGEVERITIVFDEGQDVGPDNFGAAVLDNIVVNDAVVGRGAVDAD
jgi:hypothetical protein